MRGDLEDRLSLARVLAGAHAVYVHALAKDGKVADRMELARARLLADAVRASGTGLVLYNSSGGRGCGYGISQMEQKHEAGDEAVLLLLHGIRTWPDLASWCM